jgi:NNP family nitrate/nitrite transporter-like MFS transporter
VVGLAGGLGGFILPIMFGALLDLTGVRSSAFMLLYGAVCVAGVDALFLPPGRRLRRRR